MRAPPLALTSRDFEAYLPEKATSNAFSRPRLEVKQRVFAWGRDVVQRLAEQGISVDVHATDEHPSLRNKRRVEEQWVFFWRDPEARAAIEPLLEQGRHLAEAIDDPSPYTRHAFLGLRLDSKAISVWFAVHPDAKIDVENLRALLAEGAAHLAEDLAKALRALPDQFEIRAADHVPCAEATPEILVRLLAQAAEGGVPLTIGWSVPKDTALEHAEILDDQLEDAIIALLPVYKLIAWSPENDHVGVERRIEGLHQAQAELHAQVSAETEKWRAEREAERARLAEAARTRAAEDAGSSHFKPRKAPTLATLFKSGPAQAKPAPHDKPERHDRQDKHDKQDRPEKPASKPRGASGDAPQPSAPKVPATWGKGAKVGILQGPFAGKVGTIVDLDARGGARVMLGLLSTRIEIAHLQLLSEVKSPAADRKDGA